MSNIYNCFVKKDENLVVTDVVLLKEGFSWSAFLFSGVWFFYHKMWREFFAIILVNILFSLVAKTISDFDQIAIQCAFAVIIGLNANYWRGKNLLKKDYEFLGSILSQDDCDANLQFVKNFKIGSSEMIDVAIH